MNTPTDRREYTIEEIETTMDFYGIIHIEQAIIKLDQLTDQSENQAKTEATNFWFGAWA